MPEKEPIKKELAKARQYLIELKSIEVKIGKLNAMYALEQVSKLTIEKSEEFDKLAEVFGTLNASINNIRAGSCLLKNGMDEIAKYV